MKNSVRRRVIWPPRTSVLLLAFLILPASTAMAQSADWTQWGGPNRNFKSSTTGLASSWPASGPRKLWSRDLGDGYSAIAAEGGRLYTMYRSGEQDVVVSLDAATGKTLWEFRYDAPFTKEYVLEQGPGPRAMPLVIGNQVYSAGATGKFHCLDKQTGKAAKIIFLEP